MNQAKKSNVTECQVKDFIIEGFDRTGTIKDLILSMAENVNIHIKLFIIEGHVQFVIFAMMILKIEFSASSRENYFSAYIGI